jgi:hypothetical protein
MILNQCGALVHQDQSGAPMYFVVIDTSACNDIEALMHLQQCGALVHLDQCGAPMCFRHVVSPVCLYP